MKSDELIKINIILLAAGFSRRFNGNKLLADFNGKPLYMYAVDEVLSLYKTVNLRYAQIEDEDSSLSAKTLKVSDSYKKKQGNEKLKFRLNKIICVTQYEEIEKQLKDTKINVIINKNANLGISSSIKAGINYDTEAQGYMFMVCDQPFIKMRTLMEILEVFASGRKGIAAVRAKRNTIDMDTKSTDNQDIIGNPVIFSKRYIDELLSLEGDTGGKKVLQRHMEDLEAVLVDDNREFKDIDTREVYIEFTRAH